MIGKNESACYVAPIRESENANYYLLYNDNDKEAQAEARKDLAAAFKLKAKSVNSKYISPPTSTDFAIVYVPNKRDG